MVAALRADGLAVAVEREGASFARLAVTDPAAGNASTVELGVDWRAYPPVQLAIGPVLHPADAVANKLCALFGRAEVRDYIDVHGVLEDGRFETAASTRSAGGGRGDFYVVEVAFCHPFHLRSIARSIITPRLVTSPVWAVTRARWSS